MKLRRTACVAVACLTAFIAGSAQADQRTDLRIALKQIYEPSTIEVQAKALEGRVARRATRLRVEADGIAAKPFRVTQANTKSPRFHVRDYAVLEIASPRAVAVESGPLTLPKGTEVVVLQIDVDPEAVRLRTHTTHPVRHIDGREVYGCTEFVVRLDPSTVSVVDGGRVRDSIERWLSRQS